jgi:hypothetical protein
VTYLRAEHPHRPPARFFTRPALICRMIASAPRARLGSIRLCSGGLCTSRRTEGRGFSPAASHVIFWGPLAPEASTLTLVVSCSDRPCFQVRPVLRRTPATRKRSGEHVLGVTPAHDPTIPPRARLPVPSCTSPHRRAIAKCIRDSQSQLHRPSFAPHTPFCDPKSPRPFLSR